MFEEAIKVKVGNEIKTYPRGISLEELAVNMPINILRRLSQLKLIKKCVS